MPKEIKIGKRLRIHSDPNSFINDVLNNSEFKVEQENGTQIFEGQGSASQTFDQLEKSGNNPLTTSDGLSARTPGGGTMHLDGSNIRVNTPGGPTVVIHFPNQ